MSAMAPSRLRVTEHDAKTLSWWRVRRSKIDMNPSYQRKGRLWSAADKAYLVDSIINGFDIPKLYMADFTYGDSAINEKKLPYAIIDGKQRLEAIFDFFDGKITLNPDFVFLEQPHLKIGGLGYRDLQSRYSEIAEIFDNFNLSVMSVVTNELELINELFVRLNRSKPLTGAEIRNAMAGPTPGLIREIAKHEFFRELIAFKTTRLEDQNAAAKLLSFEYSGKPTDTKKSYLDQFVKNTSKKDGRNKLELAARRTFSILDVLSGVFLPRDRLLASSGIVPVYYWFVRSIDEKHYTHVRDFLVRFEEERRANRVRVETGTTGRTVDSQYAEFDKLNRNTNDLASHDGRIGILIQKSGFSVRKH